MSHAAPNPIPGVDWWRETSWVLCDDFTEVDYGRYPQVDGYTVDVENVLTDGIACGDSTVRPEALDTLGRIHKASKALMLVTNCGDADFVGDVLAQVRQSVDPSIEALSKVDVGRAKWRPDIYDWAGNRLRLPGRRMGHIDDQAQAHLGALRAGYALHVWPYPWGEHQRPGVQRFRPIEMSVIRGLVRAYPRSRMLRPADHYAHPTESTEPKEA